MRSVVTTRFGCVHALVALALLATNAAAATLNGNAFALRSTGKSSKNSWILDRNGYLGTYITLSAPGTVKVDVSADGPSSPNMNVVIDDTKASFTVGSSTKTYSYSFALPAGTHFVRTELANDRSVSSRQLKINSMSVTGANLSNSNSNANALAASDTYINNFRKGPASVDLSSLGLAAGTKVDVSLKRIAFNFGTGVHGDGTNIDQMLGNGGTLEQQNYQQRLNQNFNTIVTAGPGFWASNEATKGQVSMHDVDEIYDYAAAHDMHTRLHNLLFEEVQPDWVNSLKSKAGRGDKNAKTSLTNAINSRIGYFVGNKESQFDEIDVYNESYNAGQNGGRSTYWNIYGPSGIASIYSNSKKAATAAGYNPRMFVNEAGVLSDSQFGNGYAQNIEALRQAGLDAGYGDVVGGIGLQFYESSLRSNLASQFIASLQNMNVQGLPTELTEFGTFSNVSANDSATIMGQAMRLIFGNPTSTSFINWDWTKEDGGKDQWAPNSALYTVSTSTWNNFTITPAGKLWQDMLGIQDWNGNPNDAWTTQLSTSVGADGKISFNGFYGDYQLTIDGQAYNLTLQKGTTNYVLSPVNSSLSAQSLLVASAAPEPDAWTIEILASCGAICVRRQRSRS
jgi:endo-1,4-beta-xylanase